MSDVKKILGSRIAELRKMRKLTQEQLSEMVNISPTTLANIELGNNFLTAETLDKIKTIFNVEYKDLFDYFNNDDIEPHYEEIKNTIEYLYKNQPKMLPVANSLLRLLKK